MGKGARGLVLLGAALSVLACSDTPKTPDGVQGDPYALPTVAPAQLQAYLLDEINAMRGANDLAPLLVFPELSDAAQTHAKWLVGQELLTQFHEQPGGLDQVGRTPAERAAEAKYTEVVMGELVAFRRDSSLKTWWLDGPWGRVYSLQQHAKYFGLGSDASADGQATVALFGWRRSEPAPADGVAIWPIDGARGVARFWDGSGQTPAAPEPVSGWPSGPVISAVFTPGSVPTITTHTFTTAEGAALAHQWVDPTSDYAPWLGDSVFLLPDRPLAADSEFIIAMEGTVSGAAWSRRWRFRTRP